MTDELPDRVRELVSRHIGERDLVEHGPKARPHGEPDLLQGLRRPLVRDVVGPKPADVGERALDRADHLGEGDLVRRPREPVAAVGAALGAHEPGLAEVAEDVLEELERHLLRLGEALALDVDALLDRGQLDAGPQRVVDLGGDAHASILTACRLPLWAWRSGPPPARRTARPRRSPPR